MHVEGISLYFIFMLSALLEVFVYVVVKASLSQDEYVQAGELLCQEIHLWSIHFIKLCQKFLIANFLMLCNSTNFTIFPGLLQNSCDRILWHQETFESLGIYQISSCLMAHSLQ